MRDIRFRAWIPQYKEMFQVGNLVIPKGLNELGDQELCVAEVYSITKPHHYIQPVLMQYTGLKDATKWEQLTEAEQKAWLDRGETKDTWNGKEIYEGDIVTDRALDYKTGIPEDSVRIFEVYWDKKTASFWQKLVSTPDHKYRSGSNFAAEKNCEVIGNIYEHSYLLDMKTET